MVLATRTGYATDHAPTDNPLKQLVSAFPADFASWLLETEVVEATPLNIELPADSLSIDQLYQVRLEDGREVLLHLEFQGRRSRESMPLRMLAYRARLAVRYSQPLTSVVIYVGQGAGVSDTGLHTIGDAMGEIEVSWRYRVVRLWQMDARELLALGRPALLALIGQCRIEEPRVLLPEVMAEVHRVNPPELRSRLVSALLALLSDKELVAMAENILSSLDEELMDLPYFKRVREAQEQGLEQGREEGREEGLRQSIMNVLTARFSPDTASQERFSRYLETQHGLESLDRLLITVSQADSLETLETTILH